jgi:hypothetical protein
MKNTAIIPAVIASVFLLQCANPVTPTGGEKDVSAPKIVLNQRRFFLSLMRTYRQIILKSN